MPTSGKKLLIPAGVAVALIVAIGSVAYTYYEVSSLTSTINSVNSRIPASFPVVDETPSLRNVTVEWALLNSYQDRFYPDFIIVNQGDSVYLTFINNDTIYAHTFTVNITTSACADSAGCLYQINASAPGLANALTGGVFGGGPTGCVVAGDQTPCSSVLHGTVGNLTGVLGFTVTSPGIFRFYDHYTQSEGMYGYIVVLPNSAYVTNSTS